MTPIIAAIRNELIENSDVQTQASSQRYFKESILCYGTKTIWFRKGMDGC